MYYLIYKTTNTTNGKIYIGCHETADKNDSYYGSGSALKEAIKKYGKDKFKRDILLECNDREHMFDIEQEIVNEEFVKRSDTYNLRVGGWCNPEQLEVCKDWKKEGRRRTDEVLLEKYGPNYRSIIGKLGNAALTPEMRKKAKEKQVETVLKKYGRLTFFAGKIHTAESKRKIGEANSIHQKGKGNSQYGTCWIYSINKKCSKKISKSELQTYLDQGWSKGRKIKF